MALHFGVEDVANHAIITTHPHPCPYTGSTRWHPVTETLVWYSIPCGFNSITQSNLEETWRRVKVYQTAFPDTQISSSAGRVPLTRDDVALHVGLWTNASRKTPTEFNKFVVERLYNEDSHRQRHSAHDTIGYPHTEETQG